MVPEIIIGSTIGALTARAVNNGMDALTQYIGGDVTGGNRMVNYVGVVAPGASIVPGDKPDQNGITWQSTPDIHGGYLDSGWDCAKWIVWHKELKKHYGLEKANEICAEWWNKQSTFDTQYNWCKYNSDFLEYFKAQGFDPHLIAKAYNAAGNIGGAVVDGAEKIAEDGIGDFGDSLSKLLKWLPWIAAGAALVFVYFYFKPFSKIAS